MRHGLRALVGLVAVGVAAGAVGLPSAGAAGSTPTAGAAAARPAPPVLERDWVPDHYGAQPPRNGALVYDRAHRNSVLLVPGRPSETWTFDGGSRQWNRLFPNSPELVRASAAYGGSTGVVLFGSNAGAGTCDPTVMGETWTWDGRAWIRLHPANAPSECAGLGSMAMTSSGRGGSGVVLVITLPNGAGVETWTWSGSTWTRTGRTGPSHAPITQFSGRTFSFGGGFDGDDAFGTATHVLRGAGWTTIAAGGKPTDPMPRDQAALTTVGTYGPVLFGGVSHLSAPRLLGDTWRWFGSRWVRIGTRHSPPAMGRASFVYDEAHDLGVLLGSRTYLFAPARAGEGYLMCASDGGVFTFGDARFYGSTGGMHLNQPIVTIARTPTRKGYWLVASDGGVFTFGDARFYGSTGGIRLTKPIVAMAPTASGRGYWLVASDGGIFSFGDAPYFGSTANRHLDQPIVGIATVQDGNGYLLVARDGRVFSFGDARIPPNAGTLPQPIVGIARNPITYGYWVANGFGRVFARSTDHHGHASGVSAPIVAIVGSPTTRGYWLFGADGKTYAFGDAKAYGNAPGNLKAPIVAATIT